MTDNHILSLIEDIENLASRLTENKKIALAISGGKDSMFLLSVCSKSDLLPNKIVVFHVNHQTRQECAQESDFIKNFCLTESVPFYELKAQNLSLDSSNFEEKARKARYQLFQEYGQKLNIQYILTAHHQEDIIETIFLKILRGSLNVFIPKMRTLEYSGSIYLYRPLLTTSQTFIKKYILENNIPYIEDKSNNNNKYLRNFLRLMIIPLLRDKVENFSKKILSISNQRIEEEDFLNQYVQKKETLFQNSECPTEKFLELHPVIQKRIIQNIAIKYFGLTLSYKHQSKIVELIKKKSTKSLELLHSSQAILRKETDTLRIIDKIEQQNLEKNVFIIHNNKIQFDNDFVVVTKKNGIGICYSLEDDIKLRIIQEGDTIPWNTGTKKVRSLLKDKKIPLSARQNTYLIIKNRQTVGLITTNFTYIIPTERAKHFQTGLFLELNK